MNLGAEFSTMGLVGFLHFTLTYAVVFFFCALGLARLTRLVDRLEIKL